MDHFIVYKLDGPLDGNRLLRDIESIIQKSGGSGSTNHLLHISIKQITHNDTTMIPKLENKG